MTRNQIHSYLGSIISAVTETPDGAPCGVVYMALMMRCGVNFDDYMMLQSLLVSNGICALESDVLRITDNGRKIAHEIYKIRSR